MTESNFKFKSNLELNEIPEARFRFSVLEEIGNLGSNFTQLILILCIVMNQAESIQKNYGLQLNHGGLNNQKNLAYFYLKKTTYG